MDMFPADIPVVASQVMLAVWLVQDIVLTCAVGLPQANPTAITLPEVFADIVRPGTYVSLVAVATYPETESTVVQLTLSEDTCSVHSAGSLASVSFAVAHL